MASRRVFMGSMISGAAGVAAAGTGVAKENRVRGANERIRFGLIGGGSRGKEILHAAIKSPNVEAAAVADIYTRRLDEVKAIAPGRQDDRRRLDRNAAAFARDSFRRRCRSGQGCLPGENDGL
jgi:hypothetical protein